MVTELEEQVKRALEDLPEDQAREVLDYIHYLRSRRRETDRSWFWTKGLAPSADQRTRPGVTRLYRRLGR